MLAAARPHLHVELAFLEIMKPALPETVGQMAASGVQRVVVVPLFMAQGAHLKRDLNALISMVKQNHAELHVEVLPAVGEVEEILEAMSDWIIAQMRLRARSGERT